MTDSITVRIPALPFVLRQNMQYVVSLAAQPFVLRLDPIEEQKLSGRKT